MADSPARAIVLVTGANSGIGRETVKALLQSTSTYHVLMGTRDMEKGEKALESLKKDVPETSSTVELLQVDVASDESIAQAFEKVQAAHGRIDVLVNNAGIALDAEYVFGDISMREAWNKSYDVNVTGSNVMTDTFMPLLLKSSDARLLFVSSGLASTGRMSEAHYPMPPPIPAGWPKRAAYLPSSYRASKTALNMAMLSWYWVLKEDGVKVWCVEPGFLATGLGGQRAAASRSRAGDPSSGGKLLTCVIEGERDADVGKVVNGAGIQPF
ncbi:putative short chain dehydrogenase [Bombardia bombarda]|uniref:Short chain dehydrogenase n=1 Tax=Bombardia bombarda TaxID=252184 RepID=A0AA39XJW3_9PEZI|nr:putative short chain dehydrogenase [Bombardia bombarda]